MGPLVCAGGGLMPCCCTQTRGASEHQGEAKVHPPRPSFLPALWLATKLQGGGGKWTGSACVPELPPPSEDGASKLKATRTQFQAAAKAKQTAPSCTPELPRPDSVGTSELQGDVHNCPVAAAPKRFEGWGDAK